MKGQVHMARRTSSAYKKVYSSRRRAAFRLVAARAKASALLVSKPEDVGYLSGFGGQDSSLLLGRSWACLITDGRYAEQARAECDDIEIHIRTGTVVAAIAEILKGRGVRCLVLQADHITVAQRRDISAALPTKRIKPVSGLVWTLRWCKDAQEIRAIRKAVRIAQEGFRQMLSAGAKGWAGRSEREVAAQLDHRMRLAGADRPAFDTIVAAGPGASQPHYLPSSRKIKRTDAVLVDWGAMVGGYCSDLTRMVFLGRISPKVAKVYEVVRQAQRAGISVIRPGVSCRSVDLAARKVIAAAGYGEQFVHSLGHGIGRDVHEPPVLARSSRTRLCAGMVVTVEPGVYLPGVGGVRIEDDILVTPSGQRRLSSLPRSCKATVLR